MPYPSPEDIRQAKWDMLGFVATSLLILAIIIEFGFIFYIAMVS